MLAHQYVQESAGTAVVVARSPCLRDGEADVVGVLCTVGSHLRDEAHDPTAAVADDRATDPVARVFKCSYCIHEERL